MSRVYILKSGNLYKIGKTNCLKKRLASLQCGNPQKIEVVFEAKVKDAQRVEKLVHKKYQEHRIRGEWFDLGGSILKDACDYIDSFRPWSVEKLYYHNPHLL